MVKGNNAEVAKLFAKGTAIPGWKQVRGKVNRRWPDTVKLGEVELPIAEVARKEFGDAAFTKPELLSPAAMEDLPLGKAFAVRHAFKPEGALTVVRDTDGRSEVSRDTKPMFKPVTKKAAKA
jgi:hypothetical protein